MQPALSVGAFIRFGWETFKKRPWFLIGAILLFYVAQIGVGFLAGFVSGFSGVVFGKMVANIVSFIISFGGQILVSIGFLSFLLKVHDNIEMARIADASHPQNFWKFIGTCILLAVIVIVGFVLLIIPGVIAMLVFMFAPYLVIDKGLGPIAALKESARITKGNRLRLLALTGAASLISFLGVLALIIGVLVAIPVVYLASVHAYRQLQMAAEQNLPRQPLTGGEIALLVVGLLLPVIIVVGLMSSIVFASLESARTKAQEARVTIDLKTVQLGLEFYRDMYGEYPSSLDELAAQWGVITTVPGKEVTQMPASEGFTYVSSATTTYVLCAVPSTPQIDPPCVTSEE